MKSCCTWRRPPALLPGSLRLPPLADAHPGGAARFEHTGAGELLRRRPRPLCTSLCLVKRRRSCTPGEARRKHATAVIAAPLQQAATLEHARGACRRVPATRRCQAVGALASRAAHAADLLGCGCQHAHAGSVVHAAQLQPEAAADAKMWLAHLGLRCATRERVALLPACACRSYTAQGCVCAG